MKNILKHKTSLLIIMVLVGTNAFTAWHHYNELTIAETIGEYPYIDPARNFIDQKDFIVNIQPLRERVRAMAAAYGMSEVSVYIEYLNTGANIAVNPENYILPASLSKVPVAMMAMKKVDNGTWSLQTELELKSEHIDTTSNTSSNPLSKLPPGTKLTLERILKELLVYSDNTADRILLANLSGDDVAAVVDALGLEKMYTEDGSYSAKEYSRIFRSLYTSSYLTRKSSEFILNCLDQAPFNDFLAKVVPAEVPFAQKYGANEHYKVYTNAGIVYVPNRPYLIIAMVKGRQDETSDMTRARATAFMQQLSKETYEYFSKK